MICLACHGEGWHDFRDSDAAMAEQLTDAEIALVKARSVPGTWMGVVECDECEGTGVISEERHADMMAAARAFVDQVAAAYEAGRKGAS
jgi:DnaJ-class molecular chaperone